MRYYSTQRPVMPGGLPRNMDIEKIENFDTRIFCEEIGREAWGYIEYRSLLSDEEMDLYELTPGGMKLYYCVTTSFNDKGNVAAAITKTKEAVSKPENSFKSLKRKDIYNDWFESMEEAEEFVEEAKRA